MWPGGEELNEDDGKPVRIYQPILYAGSRKPSLDDVTCTCIGGAPSMELRCPQCNDPLYPLAQLHTAAPLKRTLQVWACNRLSCLRSLFSDDSNNGASDGEGNALCHGGGQGVVVCRRIPPPNVAAANSSSDTPIPVSHPPTIQTVVVNEWTMQDEQGGDGNDKTADDLDMADLESKLAAMESKKEATSTKPSSQGRVGPSAKATASSGETSASSGFPMFELHSLPEPRAMQPSYDDDDVGMSSGGRGGADDKKIQQMLSQYMAMEDDEEILSVLRGTMSGGGGVGATGKGNAERDERLSASDRALWAFTDRMKLAPRQVLRYAFGGVPLWSIPTSPYANESEQNAYRPNKTSQKQKIEKSKLYGRQLPIPPCSCCGTSRVFEMQLLPSLLHVLEVDKFATTSVSSTPSPSGNQSNNAPPASTLANAYENGGMDWGNIAIYTCPNPACPSLDGVVVDEYCVVQDSVDERPAMGRPQRDMRQGDVLIQEDSKFEDDDEDDECEGIIEDEEDDGSVW